MPQSLVTFSFSQQEGDTCYLAAGWLFACLLYAQHYSTRRRLYRRDIARHGALSANLYGWLANGAACALEGELIHQWLCASNVYLRLVPLIFAHRSTHLISLLALRAHTRHCAGAVIATGRDAEQAQQAHV